VNATEITKMLALIDAAYGPKMKAAERNWELSIEVWTMALADVPWSPYGENAVSWWLQHEPWPPAPAEIRERAKAKMRDARKAQENRELMAYLSRNELPAGNHDTSLPALTAEWNRRRKAGEPEPVVSE
jgi:hypothetical protein